MDARLRQVKLEQLAQWKTNLNHLEKQRIAQGLTPDVEILNGIIEAEAAIERLNFELDRDEDESVVDSYVGLLEMQISLQKRQDHISGRVQKNRNAITYLRAVLVPGRRRQIAMAVSNATIVVILFLMVFPLTYAFGVAHPIESTVFLLALLFFAVLLRAVIDPVKGRPKDEDNGW